jgi:hypothetical protein
LSYSTKYGTISGTKLAGRVARKGDNMRKRTIPSDRGLLAKSVPTFVDRGLTYYYYSYLISREFQFNLAPPPRITVQSGTLFSGF